MFSVIQKQKCESLDSIFPFEAMNCYQDTLWRFPTGPPSTLPLPLASSTTHLTAPSSRASLLSKFPFSKTRTSSFVPHNCISSCFLLFMMHPDFNTCFPAHLYHLNMKLVHQSLPRAPRKDEGSSSRTSAIKQHVLGSWSLPQETAVFWASSSWVCSALGEEASLPPSRFPVRIHAQTRGGQSQTCSWEALNSTHGL